MLTVNTNVASLNAQNFLANNTMSLNNTMERVSSGLRINSAADDAAGLQIANRLESQTRGLNVAIRNANDGISLSNVAEGAMKESTNILQRLRDLAVQASNGTTADAGSEKTALNTEATALTEELNRIATTTKFGTVNLLDGSFGTKTFQVGANASETISLALTNTNADTLGVDALDLTTQAGANTAIGLLDTAIGTIDTQRGSIGAVTNRLGHTISNLSNIAENTSAARSRIMDADMAQETAAMTKMQIMQQASAAMLAQANQAPNIVLSLLR